MTDSSMTDSVTGGQAPLAIWPGLESGSLSDKRGVCTSEGDSCSQEKRN